MPARKRRPPVARHYKIDGLPPPVLAEYLDLLRDPRTTIDAAHAWLADRGHPHSRSAVARHRRHFLAGLAERDAHAAAVREILDAARSDHPPDWPAAVAGAADALLILHLARLIREQREAEDAGLIPAADLLALTQAATRALDNHRLLHAIDQGAPPEGTNKPEPPTAPAERVKAAEKSVLAAVARFLEENPPRG